MGLFGDQFLCFSHSEKGPIFRGQQGLISRFGLLTCVANTSASKQK